MSITAVMWKKMQLKPVVKAKTSRKDCVFLTITCFLLFSGEFGSQRLASDFSLRR